MSNNWILNDFQMQQMENKNKCIKWVLNWMFQFSSV